MSGDIRAITVKQPWAWAIAHGGKTIENRSRGVSYRGTLLIHAGLAWSEQGCHDDQVRVAFHMATGRLWPAPKMPELHAGAIVAVAELVDSHPDAGCCRPWGMAGLHHLVLADVVPLAEPVPCRGALGLWRPPVDVVQECGGATVGSLT